MNYFCVYFGYYSLTMKFLFVFVAGTVYERSGDRGRRTILAFTKSSGEPFEGKNGELSTSLMIMDESYRVYKLLAEKLNTDDGFANPGFDDQSMVSESTAF